MARFLYGTALLLALFPCSAFAGVFVSEIAWMGTEVSASNEWVELFNDGDQSAPLDGWTLKAKDGSPFISLSGTIAPRAYFLIERTDDESVPNVPADLVTTFGKGLSNEGETLDLKDASGAVIDTVKGGKDWKTIGGDAKSKLTAQKRGSVWTTAKATPRLAPPVPLPPAPVPVAPEKITPTISKQVSVVKDTPVVKQVEPVEQVKEEIVPTPVLEKVYGSDVVPSEEPGKPSITLPLLSTLLLLGGSAVVYVRQKIKTEAEKYEIIEDETDA